MKTKRLFIALAVLLVALSSAFAIDTGIEIQTQIAGIKVFIDGTLRGQTSFAALSSTNTFRIDLAPGSYSLRFEHPNYSFQEDLFITVPRFGYAIHILNITPPAVKSEALEATGSIGQARTGSINVRSNPLQAMVELDGKKITHLTDCRLTGVEIGKHKISITPRQSRGLVIEFDLKPDSTVLVMADFFRRTITAETFYAVDIETNPPGASVRINGVPMGKTPQSPLLALGAQKILISMEGFIDLDKTLVVEGPARISETLIAQAQAEAQAQAQLQLLPSLQPASMLQPGQPLPPPPVALPVGAPEAPPGSPPISPPVDPIVPDKYLAALSSLDVGAPGKNAFEEAENKRATTMIGEVESVVRENKIPAGVTLQVHEYLRRIDILEYWVASMAKRYDAAWEDGLRRATSLFDIELKTIKASNTIEPWENEKDFEQRLSPFLSPIENAKDKDLARYKLYLDREKSLMLKALQDSLSDVSMKFVSAAYYVQGPNVTFSSREFNRDIKAWPIEVVSIEPDFPYSAVFEYSIRDEKDIGLAYRNFLAALDAETVSSRIEYSYTKMPGSDNLSVIIQRASIYDRINGKLYASGGARKPVFGVAANDPSKRLSMPTLILASAIPGTVVRIGDRVLGQCPVELSIEEGTHLLSFSWDTLPVSGEDISLTLKFGESKSVKAGIDIGFLSIEQLPADGQLFIDKKNLAGFPKDLALRAGNHAVEVRSVDFKTWKSDIAIEPGVKKKLEFESEPVLVGMAAVSGGTFDMGAKDVDGRPIRKVTVSPFYMGIFEITQEQYKTVVGSNPSAFANEIDAAVRPVENVSWLDAVAFCNTLSEIEGLGQVYTIEGTKISADFSKDGYRLPTEAEWEFAAKGGFASKNYSFSGSNDPAMVAWFDANSQGGSRASGLLDPNEIGLYDMSGNVWEWCWDYYGPNTAEAQTDPIGPLIGENRVIRGGSWYNSEAFSRSAIGSANKPATKDFGIGFRIVRRK